MIVVVETASLDVIAHHFAFFRCWFRCREDSCWDPAIPSDACYTVSTEASILVPSNINPAIVKLATTNQKVQGIWMSDIEQAYPNVIHVESLPTTPSTSNEVDASLTIVLHNVADGRIMNDYEIGVFEETVMASLVEEARNFNVSYFSIHAVVVESQTLVPASMRRLLRDLQSGTFNNIVNASVAGNCNGCTSNQFHQLIDDTVNSPNFQKKLQQNGKGNGSGNSTAYFNSVNQTSVAISSLSGSGFSTRANNNGGSASAATASSTNNGQSGAAPFELWVILAACVGLVVAILVVLLVLAGRRRRRRAAEEDEMEGEEVEEKDYRREHRRHSNSYNNKPSDDVTDEDDVY